MTYSKPAMPSEDLEQGHDIRITHTKHMIYMVYVSPDMFLSAKLRRLTGLLCCIFGRLDIRYYSVFLSGTKQHMKLKCNQFHKAWSDNYILFLTKSIK